MDSGIYVIENNITGKKYVGQGVNVEKRMNIWHHGCSALLDAIEKYGEENFTRYIVEYCPPELLDEREIYYIKEFKSLVTEFGYNISAGGNRPQRGRSLSEDHRRKIGESLIGKMSGDKNPMFGKTGKDNPNYGNRWDQETKDRASGVNHPNFGKKGENSTSKYFGISKAPSKNDSTYWRVGFRYKGGGVELSGY